jgi:N utilization substance protein A
VRELNDEKIDVIEWSADPSVYIAKALSPARVSGVYLNDAAKGAKTATVVVPEDQLSLAIGRDGQNARLAAKLTAWRIDIKSLPEAASDAREKLLTDLEYAEIASHEVDTLPQVEAILAKKNEGRPVTPEEYYLLTQFVDRVERGVIRQRKDEERVEDERVLEARASIPPAAFEIPMEKFEISDRVYAVISETGLQTVGDLMLQMKLDPDSIWKLSGMGPKAMQELQNAMDQLMAQLPPVEAEALPAEGEALAEAAQEEVVGEPPVEEAAPEAQVSVEAEAEVLTEEQVAAEAEVEVEAEPEAVAETVAEEAVAVVEGQVEEEEPATFDQLFALRPEVLTYETAEEEESEEEGDKKKKKRKKKFVEMEFDPERNAMVVKKKRKRGGEWDETSWET